MHRYLNPLLQNSRSPTTYYYYHSFYFEKNTFAYFYDMKRYRILEKGTAQRGVENFLKEPETIKILLRSIIAL